MQLGVLRAPVSLFDTRAQYFIGPVGIGAYESFTARTPRDRQSDGLVDMRDIVCLLYTSDAADE